MFHLSGALAARGNFEFWSPYSQTILQSGVDLFFVISGLVMFNAMSRHTPRTFLIGRLWRIVPNYWLLTGISLIFFGALNLFLNTQRYPHPDAGGVLASFLFATRISGHHSPILYPGWTLEYEAAFYLAISIGLLSKRESFRLYGVGVALLALALIYPEGWRFVEFGLGMIAAFLLRLLTETQIEVVLWPFGLGGGVGIFFVATMSNSTARSLCLALAYALLLLPMHSAKIVNPVLVTISKFGPYSYSLYLTHVLVFEPCFFVLNRFINPGGATYLFFGLLCLSVCLFFSVTFTKIFEIPAAKYLQNIFK
jgi:exopolysaccharide production protein ExoZ